MAKLTWNFLGWIYQDGIRSLRATFEAASDGINRKIQEAYTALSDYDASIEAGAPPQIERDENGVVIEDHRDILIYHTQTAEETKSALNKALAITLFHHWERAARSWTKREHGRFATLCAHVRENGYPIDAKLEDLHLVVNLLKHANVRHGVALQSKRPDYFRRTFDGTRGTDEWYDELNLTDDHIAEFFDIIAASGPTQSMFGGTA
jgi:hypothetical protein